MSLNVASWPAKAGRLWLREMRHMLPPTLYFVCAFNIIVHTTNLLTRSYFFALSHFLAATLLALLVGKAVLVADKIRVIDRFRGAPLIKPILYKTVFYVLVVTLFRIAEPFVHFSVDSDGFRMPTDHALAAFARAGEPKQLLRVPGGHFDVYAGPGFEQAMGATLAFLQQHL